MSTTLHHGLIVPIGENNKTSASCLSPPSGHALPPLPMRHGPSDVVRSQCLAATTTTTPLLLSPSNLPLAGCMPSADGDGPWRRRMADGGRVCHGEITTRKKGRMGLGICCVRPDCCVALTAARARIGQAGALGTRTRQLGPPCARLCVSSRSTRGRSGRLGDPWARACVTSKALFCRPDRNSGAKSNTSQSRRKRGEEGRGTRDEGIEVRRSLQTADTDTD